MSQRHCSPEPIQPVLGQAVHDCMGVLRNVKVERFAHVGVRLLHPLRDFGVIRDLQQPTPGTVSRVPAAKLASAGHLHLTSEQQHRISSNQALCSRSAWYTAGPATPSSMHSQGGCCGVPAALSPVDESSCWDVQGSMHQVIMEPGRARNTWAPIWHPYAMSPTA